MWAQREACRTAPNEALDRPRPAAARCCARSWPLHRRQSARSRPTRSTWSSAPVRAGPGPGAGAAARDRRKAIEDPGYDDAAQVAAWADVEVIPVLVTLLHRRRTAGRDRGAGRGALPRASVADRGGAAGAAASLVAWRPARMTIEDDYDAESRYDREPVGALQGLASGLVIAGQWSASRWSTRCCAWLAGLARYLDRRHRRARASMATAAHWCSTSSPLGCNIEPCFDPALPRPDARRVRGAPAVLGGWRSPSTRPR